VRDLAHRMLFLAGTTLLAAAVIYGAPSTSAWPDPLATARVRVASTADTADLLAIAASIDRKSRRPTDSVKPNGAGCPGANTASLNDQPTENIQNSAPANGNAASPCRAPASDAQTDIARGQGLATPEPLNSKQLIAPRAKSRG